LREVAPAATASLVHPALLVAARRDTRHFACFGPADLSGRDRGFQDRQTLQIFGQTQIPKGATARESERSLRVMMNRREAECSVQSTLMDLGKPEHSDTFCP
jgi:hypothetical protein